VGVAQVVEHLSTEGEVGPEFKPQYCKTTKRTITIHQKIKQPDSKTGKGLK
jgi:hypothetical protein